MYSQQLCLYTLSVLPLPLTRVAVIQQNYLLHNFFPLPVFEINTTLKSLYITGTIPELKLCLGLQSWVPYLMGLLQLLANLLQFPFLTTRFDNNNNSEELNGALHTLSHHEGKQISGTSTYICRIIFFKILQMFSRMY